ncbi:hypothetical protein B5F40_01370 [Gordonibacter sp. An230]|uniref:LuxR family transcriptional regulator n=1 Tax=Gordonibacter sp. An230 TaxID=1965592 RepID=UPI000B370D8D|nr:LuxR family transcriptional regulator [Gordonibacter sp. An230]OUO92011.1 hypothetical protein B5F40_01370 [Gordonibacter sp. An230]
MREPGAGDVANAGDVGDAEGALPEALRADAEATRASGAVRTLGPTANGAALGTLGATDASDAANGATARAAAEAAGAAVGKAARAGGSGRGEARSDGYGGTRGDGCRAVAESDDAERSGASQGDGVPAEILACCQKLAFENGLTRREVEILGLIAMGRSAKYIADELHISYNTTRTHIRHVYEKLNIHAKQELIDLVLFGSNLR